MSDDNPYETFIPYRRADVIEMCLDDGQLSEEQRGQFKTFCGILSAYYHYTFHSVMERLKDFFIPANPDSHYKCYRERPDCDRTEEFYRDFERLLVKANFHPLSETDLKSAFKDKTLIQLNIDVDFDAFDRYMFYCRGTTTSSTVQKYLPFYPKKIDFELFERVILLLKYKNHSYFEKKKVKTEPLRFTPGCTYIYYYKNVPKADLEILFPNVKISMTWKDRLMFFIPAVGLGLTAIIKVIPYIGALIGLLLLWIGLPSMLDWLGMKKEDIPTVTIFSTIAVLFPITVTLGSFAVKQYLNYKNKWVEFLNDVTQTLFFRSISVNASVFQTLIDDAEEEECKEAILAYYHLLTTPGGIAKPELDARIETWFKTKFGTRLDFDVVDALGKLEKLSAEISISDGDKERIVKTNLLSKDHNGVCRVQPLENAIRIMDSIWDHIYQS